MDNATENAEDLVARIKDSNTSYRKHQCRHTMPEGDRCGSPAMRDELYCYHHHQTRRPIADARQRRARRNAFSMPSPNSRAEIQDAIGRVIAHVAGNDIDLRRAGLLLYALQLASTNIREHQRSRSSDSTAPKDRTPPMRLTEPGEAEQPALSEAEEGLQREDSFRAEAFPKPQPQLQPIRRETAAALLEALARHHNIEPQTGSHENRKNSEKDEPAPHLLPSIQAAKCSVGSRRSSPSAVPVATASGSSVRCREGFRPAAESHDGSCRVHRSQE